MCSEIRQRNIGVIYGGLTETPLKGLLVKLNNLFSKKTISFTF